jgi:outer membrane receptor for ferrienterochelin and colicin
MSKALFKIGLVMCFQLFFVSLFSQQKKAVISGTVKDSLQAPMLYATIGLYKQGQATTPVKTGYTNDKGNFRVTGVDTGSYILIISHTGYGDQQQSINAEGKDIDAGTIILFRATAALQGVTVTSKKPLVEQQDDKIIFNVENDPATKTETALDILRKTPFVSVDGDNNIQVNGQSNFKVLLNGRETAMFAQNVKDALKGFPGALITKIEVITTPSAKYDAEGVGGIINIITKKKVVGYNGSVNTWTSNVGWYNINTNFSAKFGKVGITLFYGAGGGVNVPGRSRMETVPVNTSAFKNRLLLGSRKMNNFWNFGNAEVSWELDTLNTFSFYGNISGGTNRVLFDQTITTSYDAGADSISYYDLNSRNAFPTQSVGADFIRKFKNNKEREFSIRTNAEFGNSNTFLNSVMDNPIAADRYVINESVAGNKQYTLQSDYIHPLKNNQKIESGVKAILRRANSDFQSRLRTNDVEDYKLNFDNTDHFRYNQDVYSVYSTYTFKLKKTSFRLGARLEHTEVDGDFVSSDTKVDQGYTNILPNLQATTKFSNAFTMVFSYSDRLQRPYIWNLNPFKNNNDPRNISFGNPNLDPQVIHSLSVQTRLSKGSTFAGITFTGTYSNNMIVQYATYDAISGVTSTTSGNLGKETSIAANGNISAKINNDWNVSLNGSIRYNRVKNKFLESQTNSGFGGNANLNTSYSINKRFTASGYAGFFRAPVTIQTSYPLNIWYGISAGYKLFKEKFTISAGVLNFLKKEWDYKLVTNDPAFRYTSTSTIPFRGVTISLSWNFGKLTENVSKKKGVNNDDLLSGQSSN